MNTSKYFSPPLTKAAIRSRSPPLAPLPSLSTTLPGMTAFDRAVHVVNISNTTTQSSYSDSNHAGFSDRIVFTPEEQLLLYGAYKQATVGDVRGVKPSLFDIAGRSKWQAWANMRGKTKEEASDIYVDLVVKSLTKSGNHPDHYALADEILQRPPSPLSSFLDKGVAPIESSSLPPPPHLNTSYSSNAHPADLSNALGLHQRQANRKESDNNSNRSNAIGSRSSVPSIYELANEDLPDIDIKGPVAGTAAKKEALDSNGYTAEKGRIAPSSLKNGSLLDSNHIKANGEIQKGLQHNEDNEDDDEVYQSSVEYEEDDDIDRRASDGIQESVRPSIDVLPDSLPLQPPTFEKSQQDALATLYSNYNKMNGFIEDKDEQKSKELGLLGSHTQLSDLRVNDHDSPVLQDGKPHYMPRSERRISRDGSISSGYGGSVLSDKEPVPPYSSLDLLNLNRDNPIKQIDLVSPVEPYRVHSLYDTIVSPRLEADHVNDDTNLDAKESSDASSHDAPPGFSAFSAPASTPTLIPVPAPTSIPTSGPASASASAPVSAPVSAPATISTGSVCPVSGKSASSGGVCPAAMFAQARAAAEANATTAASNTAAASGTVENSSNDQGIQSSANTDLPEDSSESQRSSRTEAPIPRSLTEPVATSASTPSSSSASSAVVAATNQGMRIGQGIVSRFSALKNSLATASSRAAALALPGNSSSPSNTVVVKDMVTNQPVTVICPHLASTQVLENEMIQLQTDISVLHERIDLLQESLNITTQTREKERRSARGIIKLVLRQGLINAILLLIVFAVLYKRRSPIAFAILAYIGQGRKEGEAGWRAFMRWAADIVRVGRRNQQYVLRAGRRNGYW